QAHAALDRMLASFPQSAYVGDAYAILARDQSDHGDFDRAHQLYDQAIAVARPTIAEVARLERARVLVSNGEDRAALADCGQVDAAAQSLREVAASTAVDAFAMVRPPETAAEYFGKLDGEHVGDHVRALARSFDAMNRYDDATIALDSYLPSITDPVELCLTR